MTDLTDGTAAPRPARSHRILVPVLLVLATVIGFVGAFSVWVNRQALNTHNWTDTSGKLLANEKVQTALSAYLVNELFNNVDVAGELRGALPPQAQALAGPAAAGLRELAGRAAPKLLASPRVQDAWVKANTAAHKQLLQTIDGGRTVVTTNGGVVTLNLHALVGQLATNLGIGSQVAAAQAQVQGATGTQVRGVAQQRLGITLPPASGELVILRSNELKASQDVAKGVRRLAIVLPAIALLMFALAVYLARGRRRVTLRTVGWCFVAMGVLLLVVRRSAGNQVVNGLVRVPSNKPAVHEIWMIATSLLQALAIALVAYGLIIVVSAWLAGHTRPARYLRASMAPTLRENPAAAYGVAGGLLLLVVAWGPTPAFRNILWIVLFAALIALGVAMLRRETEREFPAAQHGDTMRNLRAWRAGRKAPAPAPAPQVTSHLDELERLVAMHDHGDLTDEEFSAEKAGMRLANGH